MGRSPNLRLRFEPDFTDDKNLINENVAEGIPDLEGILLEHLGNIEECSRAEIDSLLLPHFSGTALYAKRRIYQ